ncbi:MAG TPA: YdiU family protein [Candidatus Agrococcus pullicola]|uniref:Protein nucleotidyltransferase YdiU n=1 Tax=Candidatus Agrococcus pullicola TaxID=2838429 RepID=A0A9D1YU82_9MICO|nr:YdiU family protein [Candidatus Agrococcus pullicola]
MSIDIVLRSDYATELEELTVPWESARPEEPKLCLLNEDLAAELGLDSDVLRTDPGIRFLLGNELPAEAKPVAQAYAGHQFGFYAPRLGDGRALLLGEIVDVRGRTHDIHLKGSGRTPFARADGFAALGPMLREYLMGEAMHALGIETTRALAVVETGRSVRREAEFFPGAVLARIASSHIRVGTFQYARSTGDRALLEKLADFAIQRHYPRFAESPTRYEELLEAVAVAQAKLLASWMLVGFVHGVMNTDNTSVAGETIDYGPCAFIDAYDPGAVFNSIDHQGRYAFANQPGIALWNLSRFADSLLPLLADDQDAAVEIAEGRVRTFTSVYEAELVAGMREKLGVADATDEEVGEIARAMLAQLQAEGVDYHQAFRALAHAARGDSAAADRLFTGEEGAGDWFQTWLRLGPDGDAMDRVNPLYVPRNHIVDEALVAATEGDLEPFTRLLEILEHPFEERPGLGRYAQPAPEGSWPHVTYCGT